MIANFLLKKQMRYGALFVILYFLAPYVVFAADPVSFRVSLASTQTVSSGNETQVNFDTVNFDPTGIVDSGTHSVVFSVAGYYQINVGNLCGSGTVTACASSLYVNGSRVFWIRSAAFTSTAGASAGSDVLLLHAGDSLVWKGLNTGGTGLTGTQQQSYMSGFLLATTSDSSSVSTSTVTIDNPNADIFMGYVIFITVMFLILWITRRLKS